MKRASAGKMSLLHSCYAQPHTNTRTHTEQGFPYWAAFYFVFHVQTILSFLFLFFLFFFFYVVSMGSFRGGSPEPVHQSRPAGRLRGGRHLVRRDRSSIWEPCRREEQIDARWGGGGGGGEEEEGGRKRRLGSPETQ